MIPTDPLRTPLLPVLESCPLQAGSLYTSYKDLSLSVEWHDLRALVLPGTEWAVILGHKKRSDPLRVVLPLPLHTTSLRPSILKLIFSSLASLPLSDIPTADEPLVPSTEDVQKKMSTLTNRGQGEDSDESLEIVSPSEINITLNTNEREPEDKDEEKGEEEKEGSNSDIDRETLFLSIVTSDSTVVYYKLSKGIKKPADIPDE